MFPPVILPPPPASHGLESPHYGCEIKLVPRCFQWVSDRARNHRVFPQNQGTADFGADRANRAHFSKNIFALSGFPLSAESSISEKPDFCLFALFVAILSVARVGRSLRVSTPDCCAFTPWFGPKLNRAKKFLPQNLRLLPPSLCGRLAPCVSGSPSVAGLHHDWSGTPPD